MLDADDPNTRKRIVAAVVVLAAVLFIVDLWLPLGVSAGLPYVAVILLSLWLPGRPVVLYSAGAATALTVADYYLSQPGGIYWMVITNRGLAIAVFWITAALVLRYKAEQERRQESDEVFQHVADAAPVAISYIDRQERIRFQNKTQQEWSGDRGPELLGEPVEELWDTDSHQKIQPHLAAAMSGRAVSFEDSLVFRDGVRRDVRAMFIPRFGRHGQVRGFDCLLSDVTEGKRAREALRENEMKLRALFQNASQGIISVGVEGSIVQANQMAETLFGYSHEELTGQPIEMLVPEGLREQHSLDRAGYFANPRSRPMGKGLDLSARRKDGTGFPVEVSLSYYPTASGPEAVSFINDITQRKRAQEQLLQASRRLSERIIQASPYLVYICDVQSRHLTYVSPQIAQILGYSPDRIQKAPYSFLKELVHPDDQPLAAGLVHRSAQAGDEDTVHAVLRLKRKDDTWRWVNVRQVVFTRAADGHPQEILGVASDITEERRIQEENRRLDSQLQQTRKLESLGALAGGIAHDFNNFLHSIIGYAELVHQNLPAGSEDRAYLDEVLRASTRAGEMVRKILAFSRRQGRRPKRVRLAEIVEEALGLLGPSVPANVELRLHLNPESGDVTADTAEILQVVTNLCTNALQAMGEQGGILEVNLERAEIDPLAARKDHNLRVGPYARLTVCDSGPGIDPSVADRLFEPFVTTKDVGHGTGLGLSVVHGIVTGSGGAITFESQSGRGTTFHVYLPRFEGQAELPDSVPASTVGGSERILLVDDEESIARLGRRGLERLGYRVTAVTSALEALRLFEADPRAYDVVITDMAMPEMAGTTLAGKLLEIRPDVPIALASGFHHAVTLKTAQELGARRLIMKPFTISELARSVREVLDERLETEE